MRLRRWLRGLRPPGIRARLVAALVITSVVTLAVAAIALLSPLERRLRSDRLENLAEAVAAAVPILDQLPPHALRPGSPQVQSLVRDLRRHTGADVAVIAPSGQLLAATDVDPGRFTLLPATLLPGQVSRRVVTVSGEQEAQAAVAITLGRRRYVLVAARSFDDVQAAVRTVISAFTTAAVIGLATALLLGLALATTLSRRLKALRQAALKVAESGLDVEMTPDSHHDEVGDLSRAFATMQSRLQAQEQARRQFVSTASHELRTPLSSLGLMLELLEEDLAQGRAAPEQVRADVARARGQAARISKLAAELLDLSRIDAGTPLRSELVELTGLCTTVVSEFQAAASVGGASVDFEAPDSCWVLADPGAVARVVRILVDNALRFSPLSEPVRVSIAAENGNVVLSVADSGPGVDPAERELIFERFRRGRDTGGEGGFGLGLAIGRELAERMHGELRLEDTRSETRFTLKLQAAPPED